MTTTTIFAVIVAVPVLAALAILLHQACRRRQEAGPASASASASASPLPEGGVDYHQGEEDGGFTPFPDEYPY